MRMYFIVKIYIRWLFQENAKALYCGSECWSPHCTSDCNVGHEVPWSVLLMYMRNNCACGVKSSNGGLYTLSVLKVNPGSNPYEDEEHGHTCGETKRKKKNYHQWDTVNTQLNHNETAECHLWKVHGGFVPFTYSLWIKALPYLDKISIFVSAAEISGSDAFHLIIHEFLRNQLLKEHPNHKHNLIH